MDNDKNNLLKVILGIVIFFVIAVIIFFVFIFNSTKKTVENSMDNAKIKAFETAISSVQHYIDDQVELCNYGLSRYDNIFETNTCNVDVNSDLLKNAGYEDAITDLVLDSNNKIISAKGIGTFEDVKYPIEK